MIKNIPKKSAQAHNQLNKNILLSIDFENINDFVETDVIDNNIDIIAIVFVCLNGFQFYNIYVALVMMTIDIILFCWYSKVWNKKIKNVIEHSPKSLKAVNDKLL